MGQARQEHTQSQALEQQIAEMQDRLCEFQQQVHGLCSQIAADLEGLPAVDQVVQLNQRLDAARQSQRDQVKLQADKTKLEKRLAVKQAQRGQLQGRCDQLLQAAGVGNENQFHAVAAAARRKAQLADIVQSCTQQINTVRSTEAEEPFLAALAEADADTITAELRQLDEQISASDAEYRAAAESLGIHRDRLQRLDGAHEVLRLQMELESTRSELAAAVDRWAPWSWRKH